MTNIKLAWSSSTGQIEKFAIMFVLEWDQSSKHFFYDKHTFLFRITNFPNSSQFKSNIKVSRLFVPFLLTSVHILPLESKQNTKANIDLLPRLNKLNKFQYQVPIFFLFRTACSRQFYLSIEIFLIEFRRRTRFQSSLSCKSLDLAVVKQSEWGELTSKLLKSFGYLNIMVLFSQQLSKGRWW